jgi:hypothetical protein
MTGYLLAYDTEMGYSAKSRRGKVSEFRGWGTAADPAPGLEARSPKSPGLGKGSRSNTRLHRPNVEVPTAVSPIPSPESESGIRFPVSAPLRLGARCFYTFRDFFTDLKCRA